MKLKSKIILINSLLFILVILMVLFVFTKFKEKYINYFKNETNEMFFILEELIKDKNINISKNLNLIFSDYRLRLNFEIGDEALLKKFSQQTITNYNISLLAFFNKDGSIFSYYANSLLSNNKETILLKKLEGLPSNTQDFVNISNQCFFIVKKPFLENEQYNSGYIAVALPYPSDSFFNDIILITNSEFFVAIWYNNKVIGANYHLFYSDKYKMSPPRSITRFINISNNEKFYSYSFPIRTASLLTQNIPEIKIELLRRTDTLFNNLNLLFKFTIITIIITFILFVFVLLGLAIDILRPVKKLLILSENVVKNDIIPDEKITRKDEFGILQRKVREMAIKLNNEKNKANQANKAKSEFLANMSHEIRTPLNAILGFAQIIESFEGLDTSHKQYIKYILEAGEHLLELINQILDLSKIESGSMEFDEIDFDLEDLIEEVCKIFKGKIKKGVEYIIHIEEDMPFVKGDPLRIKQILINLLNNAYKFTEKGYIELGAKLKEESKDSYEFLFYVKDTGKGIAKENIDKIFESFAQEDASITRRYGGTGLGLTITKKLIEKMGGKIWVESELGKGATFFFTIKLKKGKKVVKDLEKIEKPIKEVLKDKHIIAIDDNPINLKVLEKILSIYTKNILLFDNPKEFLNFLENNKKTEIDLVITDIRMPDISGFDIAKKLKADYKDLKIMALSSEIVSGENSKKLFSKVLYKPILKKEFLSEIMKIFTSGEKKVIEKKMKKKEFTKDIKILIAEDNKMNQLMIKNLLNKLGYNNFKLVDNGKKAVELVKKESFDVILMDINMPVMDGFEATKLIKEIKPNIPIYALTANVMAEDRDKCISAGMKDFIPKPFKIEAIEKVLLNP